jgi:Ca2+-binding RTX toxin-like protein
MSKRQVKSFAAPIENLEERRMMSVSYNATSQELYIYAGAGNNTINITHNGNNIRVDHSDVTGSHSDTFWTFSKPISSIRAYGYAGNDTFRLFGALPRTYCYGGLGDDNMNGSGVTLNPAISQSFNFYGNENNDTIVGTLVYDAINGGSGNDNLDGAGAFDAVMGADGDDVVRGGDGDDYVYGDNGNDLCYGGNGNDRIYAGWGNDTTYGGAGNDLHDGYYGIDVMYGEDGDDTFESWDGDADILVGGAGNDNANGRDWFDTFMQ